MIRDVCILCIHIRKLSESQENNTSCSFEVCTIHIIPCGTKLTLGVIIKIYIYIVYMNVHIVTIEEITLYTNINLFLKEMSILKKFQMFIQLI